MRALFLSVFLVLALFTLSVTGQGKQSVYDFDSGSWVIADAGSEVMSYMGRKSLFLLRGMAHLKDVEFEDGVIEVDVACHGNRGFAGIVFRYQSSEDYELVYLRPHKTGLSDAIQYMPVFKELGSWQLYSNKGFTAATDIPHNRWITLKIEVAGTKAKVYINNSPKPGP